MKHLLKKVGPQSDVQMALLVLRATPIDSHLSSPAELLYEEEWYRTYLSIHGMPVARREIRAQRQATAEIRHDACGVTYLVELSRGQHARTRQPVTHRSTNAYKHAPTGLNRQVEEFCRGTGRATSVRLLIIMVRDLSPTSQTLTAEPEERLVVTPASVEPVEELAGSPLRGISDKRKIPARAEELLHWLGKAGQTTMPVQCVNHGT